MLDLHHRPLPSLLLASTLAAACSADDGVPPEPDADGFRALTTAQGEYFEIDTWPREAIGPAMRSAAHLIVRLYGPGDTGPSNPPTATEIQGTCGLTFVSPTIAVTAGHCVPALPEYGEVEVRVPRLQLDFTPSPTITGMFGDGFGYSHTNAGGYALDHYTCALRSRCYTGYLAGPEINCDIQATDVSVPLVPGDLDIAILECDSVSGTARHDHLDVADTIAAGDGVAVTWFHELYTPPTSGPSAADFVAHYIEKGTWDTNYHYRGGGVRHQMLPLRSTDYYGDRWKVLSPPTGVLVRTNVRGCHGTSGSGALRKDASSYPELIGPMIDGGGSINGPASGGTSAVNQLCHVPGADPDTLMTMRAMHPDVTRYFVQQYIPPSCAEPDSFPNRLMYWLACDRLMLVEPWFPWDFRPPHCPWCRPFARLDAASMQAMMFSTATPVSLALQPNELGKKYRASVRVWTNAFPTTVELRMGTTTIATHTLTGQTEEWNGNDASAVLSAGFVSDASTSGPLTVATMPGSAAQEIAVSQVQLVQDGEAAAFDTMDRRVGYAVHDAKDPGAQAVLATFAGSPTGGYAAVLEPGDRLVATGLALTADTKWHVKLEGDSTALRCGLVFADGSETATDCATNDGGVVLDGTGEAEPVALFVQHTVQPQGPVSIHDVIVTEVVGCALEHDTCTAGAALEEGCDACVDTICGADPYCCSTAWDGICVGAVLTECGEVHCDASKGACTHSVCEAGAKLVSGCDAPPVSPSCVGAVCAVDPYCCATAWDGACVGEVASVCGLSCG